jgi:hypothetical protein
MFNRRIVFIIGYPISEKKVPDVETFVTKCILKLFKINKKQC